MYMALASTIVTVATKDIGGFTVAAYLAEKVTDVGTGKIWTLLKNKISNKSDGFEFRLYNAIEKSVVNYLSKKSNSDISAAICECIFMVWCEEGYLTPKRVGGILKRYSQYTKKSDILEWYRCLEEQIIQDSILYPLFMMNNVQLSREAQKEQGKKIEQILLMLKEVIGEKKDKQEYPHYLSDLPTDIDAFYIKREVLEDELWKELVVEEKSVLLYGIGGIGKTETAKAVLKKINFFPCEVTGIYQLIWVNYINGSLKDSLIETVHETKGMVNTKEAWEHILSIIQEYREKLLIVVDNVETVEHDAELERLNDLPCRVLVTSRVEKVGELTKYHIESLKEKECQEIFYHYYVGHRDDYHLKKILELIEYHTVMFEILAKTANMEEDSLEDFYKKLVQKGFRLSAEKIDSGHPLLRKERRVMEQLKILFAMTKCNKEDKELLCQLSVIPSIPFQYKKVNNWIKVKHKSQLEKLVKTGWLKSDRELISTFVMHSVVASAIRFQNEEHLYEKCRYVIHAISNELEFSDLQHGSEKAYLIPFSWSISDVLRGRLCEEKDAMFLTNLADVYFDIGNYENAYEFYMRALEINENITGTNSLLVSCNYYNLASVSYNMYRFAEALSFLKKSLKIRKRYYVSEDIEVVVLIKLLAGIYVKLNRLDWAEKLYFWTAEKLESNSETDILQLSCHYSDMATFFRERGYAGDYEKAEAYYMKAETGIQEVYGNKNHPEMAAFYDAYALLYSNMGKYERALTLLERALNIREKTLEREHPDIVQSYTNIGLLYYELTDYEKALYYLNQALKIAEKIWTGPFSFKADIYNNLGLVYRNVGNYERAHDYYLDALHIREKIYPSGHPMILSTQNNIAQVYASEGKNEEAIALYENVIREYSDSLSCKVEVDSVFLATVYDNVSAVYRTENRFEEALSACEKGMEMRKVICGEWSPDYALSLNNLGVIYYYMEKLEKSKQLFLEALEIKKSVLPEIHGELSIAYFNLGLVYDKLYEDDKALDNYRVAMEIDNELGAYEDVLFTAEYVAKIYERNGMYEEAEIYRSLGSLVEEEGE